MLRANLRGPEFSTVLYNLPNIMLLIEKCILLIPIHVLAGSLHKEICRYLDQSGRQTCALDEDHEINRKQAEGGDINIALKTTDQ